ncbi:carboxy methyl transferase for protein phosphatase 2A [Tulasnella sp. JGI-2019a]|nr:carboxy methyl transferase for protein phosphatase 2A [Tulasnella sp. JGI-2019a]KAG8995063.1 carboxy methyl transferase for protein phosphatase 2A [Tulasnella sp. JGI-2019a]KAG9023623.1 carboxy methyl transferase for protein phosphatase 2A [Tulasnella sp. JGI-2019a]
MMFAPLPSRTDPDAAIRSTDDDAAQSRLSAVRKGYLKDPFIHLLVPRAHLAPSRPPLINIGTFLRSQSIDALVQSWITSKPQGKSVQIVSLGAGTDTRFWRLSEGPLRDRISKYIEIDFPEVTGRKAMSILKSPALRAAVGNDARIEKGGTDLSASVYNLLSADLRRDLVQLYAALLSLLSPDQPTIVVAECIFPYVDPSTSTQVLQWFTGTFPEVGAIVYEMFNLEDSFGQVMRANMKDRSIDLCGVGAYPTLESHRQRLLTAGFSFAQARTLKDIRISCVSQSGLDRMSRLEWLDELEELELVLGHYSVCWGWKVPDRLTPWDLDEFP